MTFSRVSGALAAFVLSMALFHAPTARANIVFDFSAIATSAARAGALTLADSKRLGLV
jgi:hypothetical protein